MKTKMDPYLSLCAKIQRETGRSFETTEEDVVEALRDLGVVGVSLLEERAQWMEGLATKPKDLSLLSKTISSHTHTSQNVSIGKQGRHQLKTLLQ